jgi:hypothetical protein
MDLPQKTNLLPETTTTKTVPSLRQSGPWTEEEIQAQIDYEDACRTGNEHQKRGFATTGIN